MPAMVMPTEALGASEMDKPTDIKAEDVDASYAYDYTNVNENLIDVEYDIKLKYEIPSDGKTHQVLIQQKEIAVSFQYYAAPKLDKNAFLMARLTNFESLNLIPANAKIFLDGSFVSENYLDVNSNEDTLNINLGRDRSIEIKRERIKNKQVDQFLTGKIVKSYEYELTIKNPKVSNAEFIVLDQVPISNDKDIVVEIIKKDGANLEKHTGKLSWNLKLKAKETTKLNFAYEVSYPSGLPVAGL